MILTFAGLTFGQSIGYLFSCMTGKARLRGAGVPSILDVEASADPGYQRKRYGSMTPAMDVLKLELSRLVSATSKDIVVLRSMWLNRTTHTALLAAKSHVPTFGSSLTGNYCKTLDPQSVSMINKCS